MALSKNRSVTSRRDIISTFKDQFHLKATEQDEGARSRVTKTGKTVFFYPYPSLQDFFVDSVEVVEHTYKSLRIGLKDGDSEYYLYLSLKSSLASSFFLKMENIDFSRPVTMEISSFNGHRLVISQNGKKIPQKYTAENPGAKPAWKEITKDGERTFDRTEEMEYLMNVLQETILPRIEASKWLQDDDPELIKADHLQEPDPVLPKVARAKNDNAYDDDDDVPW